MTDTERKRIEAICEIANIKDIGDLNDGYHTFNQLYHQRAVLFATIVNQNKDKSWKSFKHSDGKYCFDSNGEWFIVGIDTPEGSYTYHYEKNYWDMFKCQELECGKEWDGHTEEDVIRLLSLEQQEKTGKWIVHPKGIYAHLVCNKCLSNAPYDCQTNYCPNCGAKMASECEEEKSDNPLESFLGCMKNIYLQNKDEVDKVTKEMMLDKEE